MLRVEDAVAAGQRVCPSVWVKKVCPSVWVRRHFRRSVPLLRISASGGGCSCRRTEGLSICLRQGLASPGHVASQEVCLAVIQEVCLAVILREPLSVVPLSVRESCSRWGGIESGGKVGSWWGWEVRIPSLPWKGARLASRDAEGVSAGMPCKDPRHRFVL